MIKQSVERTIEVGDDAYPIQMFGPIDLITIHRVIPNDLMAIQSVWQEWLEQTVHRLKSIPTPHFSISHFDGSDHYGLTVGCEVSTFETIPDGLPRLHLPRRSYVEFTYHGPAEGLMEKQNDLLTNRIPALDIPVNAQQLIGVYTMEQDQITEDITTNFYVPLVDQPL